MLSETGVSFLCIAFTNDLIFDVGIVKLGKIDGSSDGRLIKTLFNSIVTNSIFWRAGQVFIWDTCGLAAENYRS